MRSRGDQLLLTAMPQQVLLTFGHFQLPPTQHFGGTCSSALGLWIGRDRKLLRHTDRSYNHFSRIITPVEMSFCTSFLIEYALPATHFTPPRWGFRGSNSPTIRRTRDDHSDSDNLRTYAQRNANIRRLSAETLARELNRTRKASGSFIERESVNRRRRYVLLVEFGT